MFEEVISQKLVHCINSLELLIIGTGILMKFKKSNSKQNVLSELYADEKLDI